MTDSPDRRSSSDDLTPSLILQLREGSEDAAELLDRIYRQPLLRFCTGILQDRTQAEDAVQEAFLKVMAADTVPDHFRAWLYRIARNHCLNLARSRRRRKDCIALPSDLNIALSATGNLSRIVKDERRQRLASLVSALPADFRDAIRLRYTEGLSRSEIASVLEIEESEVKIRLFRGMQLLRDHDSLIDGE